YDGKELVITRGALRAGKGTVTASGTLPLVVTPTSPMPKLRQDEPIDLHLEGQQFPLDALSPLISLFTIANGSPDPTVVMKGTPREMAVEAYLKVTKGKLAMPTFVEPLVDGEAMGRVDAKGLELPTARFSDVRDGVVEGHGRVTITNLRATDLDIAATGK